MHLIKGCQASRYWTGSNSGCIMALLNGLLCLVVPCDCRIGILPWLFRATAVLVHLHGCSVRLPYWYTYMGRDYSVLGPFQFTTHYHHIHQHPHKHCIPHIASSSNFWRDLLDYARLECADTADLKDATWVCIGVKVSGFQIQSYFVSILVHYQRKESYCVLMPYVLLRVFPVITS